MSSITLPPAPVFNGENLSFWASKMKDYLQATDLWEVVEYDSDTSPPPKNRFDDSKSRILKDSKAKFIIKSALSDSVFPKVMNVSIAKQVWKTLLDEFQGSEKIRKIKLNNVKCEFENLKMYDADKIEEFSTKVSLLVSQMRSLGEKTLESAIVEKLCSTYLQSLIL